MGDGSLLPPYGLDQKASAGIPGRQSGLEKPGYPLNGSTGVPSLHGRIATELPRFLAAAEAPFAIWHNGAYVQGSFPCARWRFVASPDDFERNRFTAVDAGHDADTVAAMACTVSGAYHGYAPLPQRLLRDLESHDRFVELADSLDESNRRRYGFPEGGGQYSDLTSVSVRRTIGRWREEKSSSGIVPQSFQSRTMREAALARRCDEN